MSVKYFWVGFSDGKLVVQNVLDTYGDADRIEFFLRRKDARKRFEDVRRAMVVFHAGAPAQGKTMSEAEGAIDDLRARAEKAELKLYVLRRDARDLLAALDTVDSWDDAEIEAAMASLRSYLDFLEAPQ